MTDDLTIVASAYLDGESTATERAQVEADAELLAEVERLRRVRSVLASSDDDTAPVSVRERHLAAALDAWDRLPTSDASSDATPPGGDQAGTAGGASITAPISLREQRAKRRPVNTRMLTVAASVVVLVGAGLVARGALDSSGTDDAADSAGMDLGSPADTEPSLDALAAEEFAQQGEGEAADEVADAAAPPAAVDPNDVASGGPEQAPAEGDVDVLSNDADLIEFATPFLIARDSETRILATEADSATASDDEASGGGDDAPTTDRQGGDADASQATAPTTPPTLPPPVDRCGLIDDFVGFAFWDASDLFTDPIAVGIDNGTDNGTGHGEAVAYDSETCTEVARTPLP